MAIKIRFNTFNNPENPTFILAKKNENKIGLIDNVTNIHVGEKLGDLTDISFTVHKELNGKKCKYWSSIKNFRKVWCKELNTWFVLKIDTDESTEIIKQISCIPVSEFDLSNSIVHNLEVNTEKDIDRDDYSPTVFYDSNNPKISLLDRILSFTRGFTIKHVDISLQKIQRTFSLDGDNVYNTLRSIQEEFNCIFIFGSGSKSNGKCERTVSVYDLYTKCYDCGYRSDFDYVCPKCGSTNLHLPYGEDTNIFVTSEDIAEQITLTPDTDSVKNCFRLVSGDDYMDAAIRACNPNGSNYIWYFSEEMKEDMPEDLLYGLENYDILYNFYQNEYTLTLNSDLVSQYNELILKYRIYNSDLCEVVNPIKKYSGIMNEIYNAIDFNSYLQTALMPTINMETDADKQAQLITSDSMGNVAVKSLSAISKATADNAVLDVAKILIDNRYSVKIKSSTFDGNSYTWQGDFTITSYTDEEDTAITGIITTIISDNYEEFVKQKIDKTISKNDTNNYDISGLFELPLNEFKTMLKKYSLDCLNSIYKVCDACIGVMVEMGISSPETAAQSNGGEKIYTDLYLHYVQKMWSVESEIKVRELEIDLIDQVYQKLISEKNYINDSLDIEEYLGEELYNELYSYKMEDEYNNSNYISTGLSNVTLFERAREFIDVAEKELYKSAHIKYTISTNLRNLLVIDKFKKIVQYFQVGNWIRVKIDDKVYKLKLLSYSIDYDDLSYIDVEFSDVSLVCNNSIVIKSILEKASLISKSYDCVKRQASQGEDSNRWIESIQNEGLNLTATKIMNVAKNQTQYWDENGFLFREYDPITEDYLDEQLKIINSTLAITSDRWKTCKAAIGRFYYYDPKSAKFSQGYGVIADTLVGNLILSENVGIYNKNNSITLDKDGLVITTNGDNGNNVNSFMIQKQTTDTDGNVSLDPQLYCDIDGNVVLKGSLMIYSDTGSETLDDKLNSIDETVNQALENIDVTDGSKIGDAISEKCDAIKQYADDELEKYKATVGQYLTFSGSDGLTIGAKDNDTGVTNDFSTIITNDRMAFKEKDSVVAYISNRQLNIENAIVRSSFVLGNFYFIPRADGSVSISWRDTDAEAAIENES